MDYSNTFSDIQVMLTRLGSPLTPEMLEAAGWVQETLTTPEHVHTVWAMKDIKPDSKVWVRFDENHPIRYFVRIGSGTEWVFTSRKAESLYMLLLIQFPHIEFEKPSDILKMLGV